MAKLSKPTGDDAGCDRSSFNGLLDQSEHIDALLRANRQAVLGTMIAGCIHEINNPNNNILLAARLLTEYWTGLAPLIERQALAQPDVTCAGIPLSAVAQSLPRIFSMIAEDVGKISNITAQIKSFMATDGEPAGSADVNEAITASADLLRGLANKQTTHLKLELGEGLPALKLPPQCLRQVITNLLCNALQSLPHRSRSVTVSSYVEASDGGVAIRITDEGVGISPADLPRVFEPFFTTRPASVALGLGLFVSRQIVQAHGGSVELRSAPGQGTTAAVKFPAEMVIS